MSKDNLLFLGTFFILISFLLFMNVIYSYYFNLYLNVGSYIAPLFISLFIGTGLFLIKIEKKKVSIFNKILIVVFGYFFFPLIISLPYYLSIYNLTFINCYFEAISGFTSTGFTIFENIKHIDQSLIIWRSTSQWIGGLYFLFSIILLIDIFDDNLKKSLTNFISFNSSEVFKQFFKLIIVYIILTLLIFIVLKLITFRNFDALNFSLTIISSGGFLPVNNIEYLLNTDFKIIIFSFTLLISFFSIFLIYNLIFLKNKYLNFFTEDLYLLIYLVSIIFLLFIFSSSVSFPHILFSTISSVSNIGIFFTVNENNYLFIYIIFVIIGGSFFSTSSGLRFFKIFTLVKFSLNELLSHSKPKQILLSKVLFEKKRIDYVVVNKYFLSIIIFVISFTIISSLLSISNINFESSIKLGILTIMNTVNSSLFELNDFNFNAINNISKITLILFMIIGRVEFITIIILLKKYLFKN